MTTRTPQGSIALCNRNDRLLLQFPRTWFDGEQKYLSLKLPDTKANRAHAEGIIRQMEWDYLQGKLDLTYAKYFPQNQVKDSSLSIKDLWIEHCLYKSKNLKPATIHYLTKGIGRHIARCPHQQIDLALDVRDWLLSQTTPDMARRVIVCLASAVKWGIKHQKVTIAINPFTDMADDIRIEKDRPTPNAFSSEERGQIIDAFEHSPNYRHYCALVKFWFLTGCRPSEGIGLEWEQISQDCSQILFDRSIVKVNGQIVKNRRSKTNRKRNFNCQEELQSLLKDLKLNRDRNISLVFPSKSGKPIDYINFSRRAWRKTVSPLINRHSTPYNCRDTFITDQISKGVAIAVIASWCDNSVEIIEKYYFDISAIGHIKPL
jgi:integrase